jgi:Na+/phosphate symporter
MIYKYGIDISVYQGNIDLKPYKDQFVIIRGGYWNKVDSKAERNMDLCEKLDIPYGVYWYSYALTEEEAEQIPLLLHCTNDAERIGDLSLNIRVIMENITNKKYKFSESAEAEFNDLHERLNTLATLSVKLLATKSPDLMQTAKALKKEMADTLNAIESDHVSRVNNGICRAEVGISYLELLESIRKVSKNLNNIIDRCDNFYERLPKVKRQKESQPTANA